MFPSKIARRSFEPKRVDPSSHLGSTRWLSVRQRDDVVNDRETMDVVDERCARAHERSDRHHKNRRSYVRPPLYRRDSAYASEEEAERTIMEQRGEQVYANVPVRATIGRSAAAEWDDPAEEISARFVELNFSVDDEDDVKPIGDRIPSRHDRPSHISIWDHPLPSHLRSFLARRPSVLRRSTTTINDHGF
ncbi:hypothetical protein PRIPAC_80441 [Pristionchus pacificus]|uniref:Uncharacterized protein n=1 Tax=Pristionchus pacificus TaxID=54126 RepID=A0A2A6CN15_PRIPA|nr:hypothetical protein PRIPAC_80441 [Pristionchus pacificus]|eukprot:PDM79490.1 hypothetical protein PRIPAC_32069 [Pristionchus pacificus]